MPSLPPSRLILVRHGQSEFNAKDLWTGNWDVPLTAIGRVQAAQLAAVIADLPPDAAYSSTLSRARDTLHIILRHNHWAIPVHETQALSERDYGRLTGLNKWEVERRYGVDQFQRWRRGWNEPVPGGETLKDVYLRAVPYFQSHILPQLQAGRVILIAAHGNTMRALIKYLENQPDSAVPDLEMPFGEAKVYAYDPATKQFVHQSSRHIPQ